MKKLALLTIPLLAGLFAMSSITAYAADGNTIYPNDEDFIKTLSFTSLTDYAVEDDLYAFADGRLVKVYRDGIYTEYAFVNKVTAVDIKEGVIYCGSEDKSYTVTDQVECEYEFTQKSGRLLDEDSDFLYNILNGKLYVSDLMQPEVLPTVYEGEYSYLHKYGDTVYAMCGNKLYFFDGASAEEVVLKYALDASDLKITIGDGSANLKKYTKVKFVEIAEGSYITEIDLENLRGEYFSATKVIKTEEKTTALYLCESGNATIVSIKDKAYLVLKSKVSAAVDVDYVVDDTFDSAQMIGGNIYASPYVSSATVATSNATGITVSVLRQIQYDSILECSFYEVEYIMGGKVVTGYVAEGFLSREIIEDKKQPTEMTDPNYSESNDTTTIIIIFAVVVLVLVTVIYLVHLGAKKKKKDKDKGE